MIGTCPGRQLCKPISSASQALSMRSYKELTRPEVIVASGIAAWLSRSGAEVRRQLMPPSAACSL